MSSSIKSGIWMLFASINFALLNTLVKYLSEDFNLSQIIFFRSFFAVIFLLPFILKSGIQSLKTNSLKLQIIRCSLAVLAMYLWFYSISKIPLAEATAINFTAPIFGAILVTIPVVLIGLYEWGLSENFYWLLSFYLLIQILDGNVLVPILFSTRNNLHPVVIIIAVLFFGGIWGFWGLFFAIPLATFIKAIINSWPEPVS